MRFRRLPHRVAYRRMRRHVEMYFVLYLAALLLLLPSKQESEKELPDTSLVYELLRSRFVIAAERSVLSCQLLAIGDSVRVVSLDSVNIISSSGDVGEIEYEFQIEDETQGQTLTISSKSPRIGIFSMKQDTQRRLAEFMWQPVRNERRSKTLRVSVLAIAQPVVPSTITHPEIRERLAQILAYQRRIDTARTEFRIAISFLDAGRSLAVSSIDVDSLVNVLRASAATVSSTFPATFITPRSFVPPPPGDFSLYAVYERIECLPFQQWDNTVRVYGMNVRTEGRGDPKTTILRSDRADGSGTVTVTEVRPDAIRLSGTAPSSGVMTVRVTVTRSGDGKQAVVDFPVRAIPLPPPDIPRKMYAGTAYEFDAKLPFVTGQELRAVLSLAGKERSVGQQGAKFTFVPEESDIGKTFTFERFVGGKRVGEVYSVRVEEFPPPEIVELFSQGADEYVRTRCYGQVNGDDNRVTLEVKGNLKVAERFGDRRTEPPVTLQLFKISKAEADKPYKGTIRAIDAKGRASLARFIDRND
ncbi:MAG: hypothetical protein RML40_07885 [Bacteroidota bacterium]|nr:hypothetical protein [Candidatus Kapabacteria bacterium]MDW8220434.1 hypothetical protein [Bacteroidota bacterium]